MHNIFKKALMLPFLFILVASVGLGSQSLSAGTNQSSFQNETNATLFTSGNESLPILGNETIQSTLSELIPAEPENATNQSSSVSLEKSLMNQTPISANSNISALMANLTKAISKLGENASKEDIVAVQREVLRSSPFGPAILDRTYRVTVTFDSITVHNDHDHTNIVLSPTGATSRSGEWTLWAYAQGKAIDLRDASGGRLHDVDGGETINFPAGTEITVDVPETLPLSILTMGYEDDMGFLDGFCVRLPADNPAVREVLSGPPSTWSAGLEDIASSTGFGSCKWQDLGFINKFYDPPMYGEGAHTRVVSNNGDYTLRYTIHVTPPEVGGVEPGLDCDEELGVNRATASSTQNPTLGPEKTIDNNLGTYWMSTNSLNPSITLDLGAQRILCQIKIAWQDGNTHPYNFNLAVSKNGVAYTNVFSVTSSGATVNPELYNLGESDARYVKVTVTQSTPGIPNSVARISEIDVLGRFTGNEPGQPTEGPIER